MSTTAGLASTVWASVESLIMNINDAAPTTVITGINDSLVTNRKRLRFNNAMDILLLQSVMLVDAQTTPHRTMQKRFEEKCTKFMESAPKSASDNEFRPTWKTINDLYK